MIIETDKIDVRSLKGEALYVFLSESGENKEYSDAVKLLPFATGSLEEAYKILERCVKEGKAIKAFYPGNNEDASKYEYIGEVPDGALYLI